MSAMLILNNLERPEGAPIGHYYADDLESHFHVLFHEVLSHLRLTFTIKELQKFIEDYFDRSQINEDEGIRNGGQQKAFFFHRRYKFVVENNEPLTQLISDLRNYFKDRYDDKSPEEATALLEGKYGSSKEVVELIDAALAKEGWPEEDKLDQDVFHRANANARPGTAVKRKSAGEDGLTPPVSKRANSARR
jgi:hypothetical protein